ncbi:Transthyretin-like family protein [Ancylostoma duodenale]|uniref:Transthyretin-like family protein n=1 Tax=Ancylostoma duodenale TaxID=51022 RepID=A0A0C2FQZ1_9BILA|nr:Transthyretin-like family protein [Ancylostoma duodenale]
MISVFDRKLDEGRTDANGVFKLWGTAKEISHIDPQLNIYHKCNYKGPCYKKIPIDIPEEYINAGNRGDILTYFDIGVLELSKNLKGQSTDCIN